MDMKDRRTWTWGWALGLSIVLALLMGVASAGKPSKPPKPPPDPPPPVDTGLIYYQSGDTFCTMEPDGSNKQQATNPGGKSQVEHDGYWWRLEYGWDADGDWFSVVREDGQEEFQLDFDADVYPSKSFNSMWAVHAGVADGKVSFLALRGTKGEEPSEYGLQVIYIDWANKTSTPVESLIPVGPYVYVPEDNRYWMRVRYDWSPDGTSLVYYNTEKANLNRVDCDFDTESWSTEDLYTDGDWPRWSPDGTRIVFGSAAGYLSNINLALHDLVTIAPDGTNRTVLVEASKKVTAYWTNYHWSPSGSHLVYWHLTPGNSSTEYDIYRITKDGGDATNLTGDLSGRPIPVAWRDD